MTVSRLVLMVALAGGLLAAPLPAEAQQAGKVHRIGFLSPSSPSDPERLASPFGERGLAAFQQGLRELGYVEGQNITIERRWAEGKFERLPDLAAELVRLKVDVIVSSDWTTSAGRSRGSQPHFPNRAGRRSSSDQRLLH